MTMDTLPAPLVPADVDLRGFGWMELDVARLLDSDFFAISTGDEFKAAVALWCKSFHQRPAGSLPDDDRILEALSRAKAWKKVKRVALRGWIKCSDGRLYHPVVAEKALKAWPIAQEFENKKTGEAERKARERADRKELFDLLRRHGHVVPYDTKTSQLRQLAKPYTSQPEAPVDPPPAPPSVTPSGVTGHVTGHTPVTANTGQDRTGQDQIDGSTAYSPAPVAGEWVDDNLPEPGGTAYGAVARALRQAGVPDASPHPIRFRNLIDAGATAEEFLVHVDRALKVGARPFVYLIGAVEGERTRAAATAPHLHRGAMPPAPAPARRRGAPMSDAERAAANAAANEEILRLVRGGAAGRGSDEGVIDA